MFDIQGERVALVTDTACDLSDEQLRTYDIRPVALRVATSKGEFRDRTEIDPATLYQIMEHELPKTSLPLPGDVSDLYRSLLEEGADRIVHLSLSSGLSGSYNMASMIAGDFPEARIDVVDTQTLSAGEGLLVLRVARYLEQGMPVEDALNEMRRLRRGLKPGLRSPGRTMIRFTPCSITGMS